MAIKSPPNWPVFDIDVLIESNSSLRNTDPKIIEPLAQLAEYKIKSNFDLEAMAYIEIDEGLSLSEEETDFLNQARYGYTLALLLPHIMKDMDFDVETIETGARKNILINQSLEFLSMITGFIGISGTTFGEF